MELKADVCPRTCENFQKLCEYKCFTGSMMLVFPGERVQVRQREAVAYRARVARAHLRNGSQPVDVGRCFRPARAQRTPFLSFVAATYAGGFNRAATSQCWTRWCGRWRIQNALTFPICCQTRSPVARACLRNPTLLTRTLT